MGAGPACITPLDTADLIVFLSVAVTCLVAYILVDDHQTSWKIVLFWALIISLLTGFYLCIQV